MTQPIVPPNPVPDNSPASGRWTAFQAGTGQPHGRLTEHRENSVLKPTNIAESVDQMSLICCSGKGGFFMCTTHFVNVVAHKLNSPS
jgi:hypothetical protein